MPAGGGVSGATTPVGGRRPVVSPTIRLPRTTAVPVDPATAPDPTIDRLALTTEATCEGDQRTLQVEIATTNADRVVLVVDDIQVADPGPLVGSIGVTVPCDDAAHYVLVIAANPANETASDQRFTSGPH